MVLHWDLDLTIRSQPISYLPLSLWHWQEAVKAVFSGKVTVVEVYPDVTIRAANLEIPLPSVIALNEYVQQPNTVSQNSTCWCCCCAARQWHISNLVCCPHGLLTQIYISLPLLFLETSLYQEERFSS